MATTKYWLSGATPNLTTAGIGAAEDTRVTHCSMMAVTDLC